MHVVLAVMVGHLKDQIPKYCNPLAELVNFAYEWMSSEMFKNMYMYVGI